MPYRLVIFDFDGTLADTLPWFESVLDGVADRYGFRRPGELDRETLRRSDARTLLALLGVPRWKLPFIARHMRRLKSRDAHTIRLFAGAAGMLDRLADHGVTLAIVSSNSEANIRRVLGPADVARIAHLACSASLFGKPAKIRRVLRRAGVSPGEALYVGDELRDAEAAARAGVAFAAASWGYAAPEALARTRPVALLPEIGAITDLVLRG